ncbi:MAG: hypothetical protein AAGB51_09630 [Planctomycetota bacterium]
MIAVLAQSSSSGNTTELLFWVGVLAVVVIIGGFVMMAVRRRMLSEQTEDRVGVMEELRRAVRDGDMTPEEFEATKRVMAARFRGEPASSRQPTDSGEDVAVSPRPLSEGSTGADQPDPADPDDSADPPR